MDKTFTTGTSQATSPGEAATVPIGEHVLGRVLNVRGEVVDGLGPITGAPHAQVSHPVQPPAAQQLLETGIKVVDLFAPIVRGGMLRLSGLPGVGVQVLIGELIYRLAARRNGCAVWVSWEERMYRADYLMRDLREMNAGDRTAMVLGRIADPPAERQKVLLVGVTMAEHFRDQGRDVLLVLDAGPPPAIDLTGLKERLLSRVGDGAITVALFEILSDEGAKHQPASVGSPDCWLTFDVGLARQRLYPAVDPLESGSRLLESGSVSEEHAQVAGEARGLLRRYRELGGSADDHGIEALPPEDRQLVLRARRLRRYLTQPFFTTEPWTALPGEYVRIEQTIQDVKALLEGRYDDSPEEWFSYVGTIEQALEKGKIA